MRPFISLFPVALAVVILFTACEKEKAPLSIPSTYESAGYDANVTAETSIRAQLAALTSYMKKGENASNKLQLDSLNLYFSGNGAPSLASVTRGYYKDLITGIWFQVMVDCSQNTYDPMNGATATNGGVYGARLFDRRAKETLQEIEKGLFEAALYNHFLSLAEGPIDEASVDKMVCIYGAHPTFPNTNTASRTSAPDSFIALYAARRDKNDGNGLYTRIKDQFITLRAAVQAGADYQEERDEAVAELKLLIEKAIMATVVHYGHTALSKLSSTNPPATTISGGLHDLAEAVGFTHGFKAIPPQHRRITDAQIDELLGLMLSPAGAESTIYKFVTDGATELPRISQYQQRIKAIYGFTDAEMEDFKQNWIAIQGR